MIHRTLAAALALLAATPLAAQDAPAEAPAAMPSGEALKAAVEANDARLFWGFFEGCDPELVADLVHPDFRMLHDLVGMSSASGAEMVAGATRNCDARKPGGANEGYRNRRLFVPGSRRIQQLGDWGVLEEGHHTFHEWRRAANDGAGGWVQTGGGRYIHVWKWMPEEGSFRLLESLSLDHGPAPSYPPALD